MGPEMSGRLAEGGAMSHPRRQRSVMDAKAGKAKIGGFMRMGITKDRFGRAKKRYKVRDLDTGAVFAMWGKSAYDVALVVKGNVEITLDPVYDPAVPWPEAVALSQGEAGCDVG